MTGSTAKFIDSTPLKRYGMRKQLVRLLTFIVTCAVTTGCGPKYRIGDLYNADGKTGIVFSLSDKGRHGKILSLEESKAYWQTGKNIKSVEAEDELDGAVNMAIIRMQPDWQSRYPAFAWCAQLGEGWYLPALGELTQVDENRELINDALKNADGTPLYNGYVCYFYWSSTEAGDYTAYGGYMYNQFNESPSEETKIYTQRVRAVTTF